MADALKPALIATLGMTEHPLQFQLDEGWEGTPFEWVTIITTPEARSIADRIKWLSENPAKFEIDSELKDDASVTSETTSLILKTVAKLREKGHFVISEITGGRKWMSAAMAAAASVAKTPTIYVWVDYDENGDPMPETMKRIVMTNVLEEIAHMELKRIETLWAARDFPATINASNELAKTGTTAFLRELGGALAGAAHTVHDIDRFEQYRKQGKKSSEDCKVFVRGKLAADRLFALASEWNSEPFSDWVFLFADYINVHEKHLEESKYSLGWLYGLLATAHNCIEVGRYDDAAARVSAVLEWSAKVALYVDYKVQVDNRKEANGLQIYDDSSIGKAIVNRIDKPWNGKASGVYYLGGMDNIRLVRLLNEMEDERPITLDFRKALDGYDKINPKGENTKTSPNWNTKYTQFINYVHARNQSVLAHGREAVSKEVAENFYNICIDFLADLSCEDVREAVNKHLLPPPPLT